MADWSVTFVIALLAAVLLDLIPVFAAAVNVEEVYSKMDIVSRLRILTKESLKSGKIQKSCDGISTGADPINQEGSHYNRLDPTFWSKFSDSDSDWSKFETEERKFRMTYSTKPLKTNITYTHSDPSKWLRLFNLLHAIFFKDNTFNDRRPDGKPFSVEFLLFVKRIMKKFPLDLTQCVTNNSSSNETCTINAITI